MLAAAEIFRHSCHLYVFRTAYGQEIPLTADMQTSLETALDLLPKIPSALGPGANLGWCLVVLGAELNPGDDRVYVRSRWEGLQLLGIHNSRNGQNVLEEVWRRNDSVGCGTTERQSWQDVMQRMGESQILI